jgi:AraC-like DNA-binding protein
MTDRKKIAPAATPDFYSVQVRSAQRFLLDLRPRAEADLTVISGGWERCAPEYRIRRANFPWSCIEFVAGGAGELTLAGRRYRLTPGVVFAYGPNVPHDIRSDREAPLLKYFLDFTGARAAPLLRAAGLPPGRVSRVPEPVRVRTLFDDLLHAALQHRRYTPRICANLTENLLLTLADRAVPYDAARSPAYAAYVRCREFLDERGADVPTVAAAAAQCHVSAEYLCRLFRRFEGRSPYQLLLRARLQRGATLLQDTDLLVKEVAARCSFADAFHFSHAFKKAFGVNPAAIRQLRGPTSKA